MPTTLAQKIRQLRLQRGLTLDQLAKLTESSKSYIWELENKDLPRPSAEKLSRVASALGTTLEYLMDQEEKVSLADSVDAKFYRQYQQMPSETKEKIRKMVEIWDDA